MRSRLTQHRTLRVMASKEVLCGKTATGQEWSELEVDNRPSFRLYDIRDTHAHLSTHVSGPIDSVTPSLLVDDGCFNREVHEHGTSDDGTKLSRFGKHKKIFHCVSHLERMMAHYNFQSPLAFVLHFLV